MAGPRRRISLVSPSLPAIVIAWTGLSLAAVTAFAQSPPVRGGASGELRTPSGFSPIELHNSAANAPDPSPSQTGRFNSRNSTAGKTPIRRDSAPADNARPVRTGLGSLWTTLGALAAVLIGVVAATRCLRRLTGRPGASLPSHAFDVVGSRRLDAQSSIHLVRIGRRIVAVGSSAAGVQPLTVINDPLEVEELLSGGAAHRTKGAVDSIPPLFGANRTIRRVNELPAAEQSSGGDRGLRRPGAAFVSAGDAPDA